VGGTQKANRNIQSKIFIPFAGKNRNEEILNNRNKNTQINSINQHGRSVCKAGAENYTTFRLAHRPNSVFYQYDYRHKDSELFSTVAPTLEGCRDKRDKWLQAKNFKRLFPDMLKRVQENKRLTKSEMGYQIGHIEPLHSVSLYWDTFSREEVVSTFNKMFGTAIK
jgi:hypothetical protein